MTVPGPARASPRGFDHVDTWVFDLDNTLYPYHLNLWQQVDDRIRDYIARFLAVSRDEAFRVQKDYYKRYGTTLRGMMIEHGMKPDDFLDYVHQIDYSPLEPDAAILLCSDGLSDMLPTTTIAQIVRQHAGAPPRVVEALVTAANDAGGRDNITVVYAEMPLFAERMGSATPDSMTPTEASRIAATTR